MVNEIKYRYTHPKRITVFCMYNSHHVISTSAEISRLGTLFTSGLTMIAAPPPSFSTLTDLYQPHLRRKLMFCTSGCQISLRQRTFIFSFKQISSTNLHDVFRDLTLPCKNLVIFRQNTYEQCVQLPASYTG